MMSIETIIALNADIGRRAARRRVTPFVPKDADEANDWSRFPNIGSYQPRGWEEDRSWFVDKTGMGLDSEPAYSWRQFRDSLADYVADNAGHAFAITEEGPFQVIVSAFRPI